MSEYDKNGTNYEPNFVLKPARAVSTADDENKSAPMDMNPDAPAKAGEAPAAVSPQEPKPAARPEPTAASTPRSASEAKQTTDSEEDDLMTYIFGEDEVAKIKDVMDEAPAAADAAEEPRASRPESAVSDVLKAAAARADALKQAAAKAEQASEPYRRETNTMNEPIFSNLEDAAAKAEKAQRASAGNAGSTGSGFGANNYGSQSSNLSRGYGGQSGSQSSGQASSYGSQSGSQARGYSGQNAAGYGNQSFQRSRFENPSFDPGKTSHYTDPRDHFRAGESASWTNGEVHRNRRQMKDIIHKQKKTKRPAKPVTLTRKALALLIAGCLCLSCLTGLGGAALGIAALQSNQANTAQTTTAAANTDDSGSTTTNAGYTLENATGSDMTIKEITAATKSSVVEIRTESVASDTWMQQYVMQGAGSGVIISKDGYIMTNNHVIEDASKIKVTTADEKEYDAKLIGADENNDVAVIKIDASGLKPATYGNSDSLEVGDMAVAIGNPLGELGGTVTAGIISATDRELSIDGKTLHLLQTDSSINPGNSGGGLFNSDGQLVGLVVAKSSGSGVEGLGFAIPINKAADVANQLIKNGYVSGQPSTGMTYQEGTANGGNSDMFNTFDSFFGGSTSSGVYIYSVNGKNAKKAGFQPGDQVYAVDGEEIATFDDLSAIITSHKVGDKVKFTIIRDGVQKNIKLELEEKTASSQNGSDQPTQNEQNDQTDPNQSTPENGMPDQDQDGQIDQYPGGQDDQSQGNQGNQEPGSWQDWFNMFF